MENTDHIKDKFDSIALEHGYELVELTGLRLGGRTVIRAFIHKSGGVNIDDCKKLSRAYSDYLDAEDVIKGKHVLEISSLGLDRPLMEYRDFRRRIGETIQLELRNHSNPASVTKGKLIKADESGITISDDDQEYFLKFGEIVKGKIIY